MNINDLQLQELRRFAELGKLSATVIHEISNPLTAAILQLELSEHASPAIRKAYRNMQVLRGYVESARQQMSAHGQPKKFSVRFQFRHLKRILRPIARQAHVELEFGNVPAGCTIWGDPVKFQQLMSNLVVNAIQAYDKAVINQQVSLVKVNVALNPDWLVIQVHDSGVGIAPDKISLIFSPFYTTKINSGQGVGFGLTLVKKYVIEDFKGTIEVSSMPNTGTLFTVRLPLVSGRGVR